MFYSFLFFSFYFPSVLIEGEVKEKRENKEEEKGRKDVGKEGKKRMRKWQNKKEERNIAKANETFLHSRSLRNAFNICLYIYILSIYVHTDITMEWICKPFRPPFCYFFLLHSNLLLFFKIPFSSSFCVFIYIPFLIFPLNVTC